MLSSLELRWAQKISEASTPFRGPFSIVLWRPLPVALSFWAPSSSLVCPAFFFMGRGAPFLGYEGFFAIDVLLRFFEQFNHACLRIFRDGKHQVFRLHP